MLTTTPITLSFFSSALFVLSCVSSVSAQVVITRRRSTASRIIAGIVVGVVCLFLLILFCIFARRHRRRMGRLGGPGIIPVTMGPSKPLFGGPWGRHNHAPPPVQQQSYFGPGNSGWNNTTNVPVQSPPTQQPYNPEYPPPTGGPAPPPAYEARPNGTQQGDSYAPPPGPPPPAHTKGHDGNFVGGFRS